jgi:hypothetical protein
MVESEKIYVLAKDFVKTYRGYFRVAMINTARKILDWGGN